MSDQPEEQDGTEAEVTEQTLEAWSEPAEESTWAGIEAEAESAAPGPAGPGASPEPLEEAATEVQPATEAGRSRRPTSLRDRHAQSESVPRRKLSPPAFPSAPPLPGSPIELPVSGAEHAGSPADVHNPKLVHDSGPAPSLKDKLPLDKLSLPKLPLSTDKLPVDKLRTLTKQRPEVGLGFAFAGGLVIATILKRLARR